MNLSNKCAGSKSILQINKLVKYFGGIKATDELELNLEKGSIHALIGPNGAGKTTLIHQLSGLLKPDKGYVLFEDSDITNLPMNQRVHLGLVRSYQIASIFLRLTVLDNIALAVMSVSGGGFHFWQPARSDEIRFSYSKEIADRVGLGKRLNCIASSLSHGEKRQLEVGIALATRPKLLLLDEPMAGLGADESELMLTLIKSLSPDISILLVEHDMDAVFKLASQISVLVSGKIIATGNSHEIKSDPKVKAAYLGEDN